jgi:GTP-binding protein EngB required for normal cell division
MTPEERSQLEREIEAAREELEAQNNTLVSFAIVGPANSGKSSLHLELTYQNDVENVDELIGSETDKTTQKRRVVVGRKSVEEFPGFGTEQFEAATYIRDWELNKSDVYIFVFADVLRKDDLTVLRALEATGKQCILVRNKCDAIKPHRRSSRTVEDEKSIIRSDVSRQLGGERDIYFTSCIDLTGIEQLQEAITLALENAGDSRKSNSWIETMKIHSARFLNKKRLVCITRTYWVAGAACALGIVPSYYKIPGLSASVNVGLMLYHFDSIKQNYGITDVKKMEARIREALDAGLMEHLTTELAVYGAHTVGTETAHQAKNAVVGDGKHITQELGRIYKETAAELGGKSVATWIRDALENVGLGSTYDGIIQILSQFAASNSVKKVVVWIPFIGSVLGAFAGSRIIYLAGKRYVDAVHAVTLLNLRLELVERQKAGK